MECPVCRATNISGLKYCIKCGRSFENLPESDYMHVDKGGYHTEEEYLSEQNGFKISDGTFTINDRQSSYISQSLFTSEELNNSVEELDFGGQTDSPEELDSGGQTDLPEELDFGGQTDSPEELDFGGQTDSPEELDFGGQTDSPEELDFGGQTDLPEELDFSGQTDLPEELDFSGQTDSPEELDFSGQTDSPEELDFSGQTDSPEELDFGGYTKNLSQEKSDSVNEEPLTSQPYSDYSNNSVPLPAPPYKDVYGIPQQIIGYDQNGMPLYGQSSYQSQFIGYDQNGMPLYSQPLYQPQFIGYDQNGVPLYSQPSYQPQFIGYDQNGVPLYSQSSYQPQFIGYNQNGIPVYSQPSVYTEMPSSSVSQNIPQVATVSSPENDDTTEKFMDFLDDGKSNASEVEEDFFEKSSDMGEITLPIPDAGSLKKHEQKKKVYMTDVEIDDTKKLMPNNSGKFSQKYMRRAESSSSGDLGEKRTYGKNVTMRDTGSVDAEKLNPKFSYKSRIRMGDAGTADSSMLNTYTPEKKKFTMAEADHAVEAMPKKKKYVDELDLIELPEYMQARKTVKKDKKEFPSMTDL